MKRSIAALSIAGFTVLGVWGCQAGGWRDVSVTMDGLERDLRNDGLVTIKRPDVWTENRLHTYRSEFEEAFKPADDPPFSSFEPTINATAAQAQVEQLGILVDAAIEMSSGSSSGPKLSQYLATALLGQFDTADGMSSLDFTNLLQTAVKAYIAKEAGIDPATLLGAALNPETTPGGGDTGGGDAAGGGAGGDAPDGQPAPTTNVTQTVEQPSEDEEEKKRDRPQIEFKLDVADILKELPKTPGIELLSPFEKQAQKRAFVQQNQLFRIGNEPDDGTRMNGYRLYYMRFMVSVTPSGATQKGRSAEILLSPSYNVMDAARDWAAQYARALLRERLLRTVESALERRIRIIILDPCDGQRNKRCAGNDDEQNSASSPWTNDVEPLIASSVGVAGTLVVATCDCCESEKRCCGEAPNARHPFHRAESLATLRFNMLRMRSLAELAYDELAREIDYLLGVPNAVQVTDHRGQTEDSVRIQRAKAALCAIKLLPSDCEQTARLDLKLAQIADPVKIHYIIQKALARLSDYARAEYERRPVASAQALSSSPGRSIDLQAELLFENRAMILQLNAQSQLSEYKKKYRFVTEKAFSALRDGLRVGIGDKLQQKVTDAIVQAINDVKDRDSCRTDRDKSECPLAQEDLDWIWNQLTDAIKEYEQEAKALDEQVERLKSEKATLAIEAKSMPECDEFLITRMLSLIEQAERLTQEATELREKVESLKTQDKLVPEKARSIETFADTSQSVLRAPASVLARRIIKEYLDNQYSGIDPDALRYFFSPKNWPVYTFAVAPFSEVENIARAVQLNSELQFMLSASLKFADMGEVNGALQYIRALREEFQAIQINRTVVGLVRGEQHFGWQFNPPYSIPVRRERSFFLGGMDKLVVDEAESQTMPSRTYEVFALVAVPGFLRSMEFTVHSDWTNSNRSDGTRVGTAKAVKYLRRYRWLQKRVGEQWREGRKAWNAHGTLEDLTPFAEDYDYGKLCRRDSRNFRENKGAWDEDNIFLGELLADRLDLLEASLPLRKMRKVFLPYADVSERMTNTAGIENLRPKIYQITPVHIPSHHKITITIEGKNFDTGRVQVFVAGIEAKVKIANDRTIVAEVPERKFIGDLDLRARKTIGGTSGDFKANVNDLEGLAIVTVITPVGVATDTTLIRLTKKELAPKAPKPPTAALDPSPTTICLGPAGLVVTKPFTIKLSAKVAATTGTVVLKYEEKGKATLQTQFAVFVAGDKVTQVTPLKADSPPNIEKFYGRTVSDITLYLYEDKSAAPIKVTGKLTFHTTVFATIDPKSASVAVGKTPDDMKPSGVTIEFACPLKDVKKGSRFVLTPKAVTGVAFDPKEISVSVDVFSGAKVTVDLKPNHGDLIKWLSKLSGRDLEVTLELKNVVPAKETTKLSLEVKGTLTLKP